MKFLLLQDDQAASFSTKEKLLYWLITAFWLAMYLPHVVIVPNILLGGIALLSFFYNGSREKMQLLRSRKEVLVMVLFYGLHVVSALFSDNKEAGFTSVVLRLPLLAFPLVLGWIYITPPIRERILYAFSIVTILVCAGCLVWGLVQYQQTQNAALLYNDSLTLIIDKQSIYVAMLVNLALFSITYLLYKRSMLVASRGWVYAGMLILLVAHFLLASRIAITILYGSIFCFALFYLLSRKKYLALALFVVGIAGMGILLVSIFPKTLNRFRELTYTRFDYRNRGVESHYNMKVTPDQWNGANIRLAVWSCGWELVKQHPILGVQTGDKMDALMEVYAARGFDFGYNTRRNLHNNYLDVLVAFGVVGLMVFVTGFFIMPFYKVKDMFGRMVLIAFALSLVPETYMDRTMGNMMLSFWVAFVISCYPVRTAR